MPIEELHEKCNNAKLVVGDIWYTFNKEYFVRSQEQLDEIYKEVMKAHDALTQLDFLMKTYSVNGERKKGWK